MLPLYCGNYDHQTVVTFWASFAEPTEVYVTDCRRFLETQTYVKPKGGTQALEMNSTTHFNIETVGRAMFRGTQDHLDCFGGVYTRDGAHYTNIVINEYLAITLEELLVSVDSTGQIIVAKDQIIFPCTVWVGHLCMGQHP